MQGLIHQKMNSRAVLGTITQSTPAGSDTGGSGSREHIAVTEPKALPEEPGGPQAPAARLVDHPKPPQDPRIL